VPGAASSASGAVAGALPGSVNGGGSAAGSSSSSGGSRGAGGSAGRGSAGGSGRGGRAHAASTSQRRHAQAVQDRRLRRDVARFAGCLEALPGVEGPLLAIRAGIGGAEPASLGDAARRLGISTHRAARIERRGLRQLRAAGRSGACAPGAAASRRSIALGTSGAAIPQLQPAVLLTPRPALKAPAALASPSGASGAGGSKGGSSSPAGSAGGTIQSHAPAEVIATNASSKTAAYLAGLALFALLLAALAVAWRRRSQTPAARLAEQTGTAAVWWPPARPELPPGPAEPPFVAAEVVEEGAVAAAGAGAYGSSEEEAPTGEHPPASATDAGPVGEPGPAAGAAGTAHRRRPRRGAVATASLVSLGVALLRRRRR
jgi:hypothetical protein